MTFSKRVLSTDKQKTTLNWWEYHIGHCWMTGWQTIGDELTNRASFDRILGYLEGFL